MSKKKANIFIIAYACEPNGSSEPGVGWNFSREVSLFSNLTVLTRLNNKHDIEKANPNNINFIYYDLPSVFLYLKKRIPFGTQLYFLFWQWGVYLKLRKHIEYYNIDLLHHLNFSMRWNPPPFFLIKKPIMWGPIAGGSDIIPFTFLKKMGIKAIMNEAMYYLLNLLSKFSTFLFPKNLKAIVLRTNSSLKLFKKQKFKDISVISETASEEIQIINYNKKKHNKEFYALCIGRLNYWKGFFMAVKGFHLFLDNGGKGKLEIYGEGPELKKIKRYIDKHNLNNHVKIKGFVSNIKIKEVLRNADVLLHPSFREGGSWSIMEAMSYGLPVICLDTSGPKDMVTEHCGILVSLKSRNQIIKDIGSGLSKLHNDIQFYQILSANAYNRIKNEYTWHNRGQQIKSIYDLILED